ncbi:hypothetical protein [Peijinzhouia sedimentorum]
MIHRGKLLEEAVHQKYRKITDAAKALDVSRGTLYRYFKEERLGDDLLLNIGRKIGYDFTKDDKSLSRKFMEEPVQAYVAKLMENKMNESVMIMVTIDGDDKTLNSTIEKLKAINDMIQNKNFITS